MLCFSIVSLFMALTLASLSWFGAEMAAHCQAYWQYYCVESSTDTWYSNTTLTTEASYATGYANETTEAPTSGLTCADISHGYCGTLASCQVAA